MNIKHVFAIFLSVAIPGSILGFTKNVETTDRTLEALAALKPAVAKTGENSLDVSFTEALKPVVGLKLTANVGMTNMDMGTAHPGVKESSPGHYVLKPMFLMDGPWRVTLVSKDPKFTVSFDISAGAKAPWKSVKQTLTVLSSAPAAPPAPSTEPQKTEPPKSEPVVPAPKPPAAKHEMGYGMEGHVASSRPQLKEKSSYVWTGKEDWDTRTHFGKLEPMVRMMTLMMVGGSGMEGMKMAPMDMVFNAANFTEGGDDPMKDMPGMNSSALKVAATLPKPGVGDNDVSVNILTPDGKPVIGAKITTSIAMTSMDMGTTHPAVKELGKGKYAVKANFSMGGPWRLTLIVTAPGLPPSSYVFDFEAK